jgi:hypothetical protein
MADTFVPEANALTANLNSIAAGGAYAIPYQFSSANLSNTTGMLSMDNAAAQSSTANIYINRTLAAGTAVGTVLDTFDDSTSVVKGVIRIQKQGDTSKWLMFAITAMSAAAAYNQLNVLYVGGSSANPFTLGDALLLYFQRNGDKGDTGPMAVYPYAKFTEQLASGTAGASTGTGTATRPLNTVAQNSISGASLASSTITLPAGTYDFRGRAGVAGNANSYNKSYLQNVTDSIQFMGSARYANVATQDNCDSFFSGRFTIAATKTFQIRTFVGSVATTFGAPASGGAVEIYSEVEFWKVA